MAASQIPDPKDHSKRLVNEQLSSSANSTKLELAELKEKLALLFPGFETIAVRGPCDICKQKWLATEITTQSELVYSFTRPPFNLPRKLSCICQNQRVICLHCLRQCSTCSKFYCMDHEENHDDPCNKDEVDEEVVDEEEDEEDEEVDEEEKQNLNRMMDQFLEKF